MRKLVSLGSICARGDMMEDIKIEIYIPTNRKVIESSNATMYYEINDATYVRETYITLVVVVSRCHGVYFEGTRLRG